jgi:hypothetical protein
VGDAGDVGDDGDEVADDAELLVSSNEEDNPSSCIIFTFWCLAGGIKGIWPAVAANTLAAVTRAIGCVAASDLATAIAAAAAVEIVGVAAASAAADIEAGDTAAAEAASVESVTVMSAAADVAAVAAVALAAAAALAAVPAAAAGGTGAAATIAAAFWPGWKDCFLFSTHASRLFLSLAFRFSLAGFLFLCFAGDWGSLQDRVTVSTRLLVSLTKRDQQPLPTHSW